jgi:hypothetical protein
MRHALLAAAAVVFAITGIAHAQQPTAGDIALCNQEAEAATGGSALPSMPGPRGDVEGRREPAVPEGAPPSVTPPATHEPERRTGTDWTGTVVTRTPDPLLVGMAAAKIDDHVYRTAYRECMQRQLGRR